jgi:hypothetical protein
MREGGVNGADRWPAQAWESLIGQSALGPPPELENAALKTTQPVECA